MFTQFYNQTIRKMVVAFGSIFNQIHISRIESSGTKYIEVPIAYAPKEKYKVRLGGDPYLQNPFQITLPRIAFEITGFAYDPSRKRNSAQRNIVRDTQTSAMKYTFAEVPYNIDFGLYVYTRNMDDGLQIIEQILPYFAPEFVVSMNFDAVNTKVDVPIYLNSVTSEEDYEGDFQTRRSIIFTLNFTMKSYLFGPVRSYSEIRKVNSRFFDMSYYDGGYTAGYTGAGSTASNIFNVFVGISGASGASSDKYTYSPYAKIYQADSGGGSTYAAGMASGGVTVGWFGVNGTTQSAGGFYG
jgi:hypothetical protein